MYEDNETRKQELLLNVAEDVAGLLAIGVLFFAGLGLPYIV